MKKHMETMLASFDGSRRPTMILICAIAVVSSACLRAQMRTVDFGDVAIGKGVVRPVAQIFSDSGVLTYVGAIEGSSQFFFDPASQQVGPGGPGFMFIVFRPKRLGPDSALARLGVGRAGGNPFRVIGNGVVPLAASEHEIASGVTLRQNSDELIIDVNQIRAGRIRISLWSLDGRLVTRAVDELVGAGSNTFRIDVSALALGSHLCRIESSEGASTTVIRR